VQPPKLGIIALVSSGLVHSAAYFAISNARNGASSHRPAMTASFAILPAAPEPAPAVPPVAEPEPPMPPSQERARPRVKPAPADPPETPAQVNADPDPALAPADLTGITLTNARGTGWASATGDGSSRTGPLRNVQAVRSRAASLAAASSKPVRSEHPHAIAPPVVAAEDLSRPPRAPDLNGALEANYPSEARALGISGMAVIRALISPAGEARALGILSESAPGFGAACLKTLMGSRWSAPVDRTGRAVATEIRYRCTFKVAR
jgi:outer membrane biosynthesis protein TonB